MQGSLQPGALIQLLGELFLDGKSGWLHLERGGESLDVGLNEGRIVGGQGLERPGLLFEAFAWEEGLYSFEEGRPTSPGEEDAGPDLTLPELIREGVGWVEDPDVVRRALGDLDRVLVLAGEEDWALVPTPAERLVLSQVDGSRSIRELIALAPLPAGETLRSVLGLLYTGALRPLSAGTEDPPTAGTKAMRQGPPPPPQDSPPRQVPQESLSAGDLDVSEEPQLARQRPATRDAFEALGIPWEAPTEDPVENALQADAIIRRASHLMAESDHWGAIRLLEAVIPRTQARRLRHDAQVLLARAHTKNPKWVRRGELILQGVIREDPSCAQAYFALGTLYKEAGLGSRARAMFRKVLELKPRHAPAAEELRSLDAPSPRRGLFGRT